MASDRWVVNASPLILLGKVEQIQLLGALAGEIAVPRSAPWVSWVVRRSGG